MPWCQAPWHEGQWWWWWFDDNFMILWWFGDDVVMIWWYIKNLTILHILSAGAIYYIQYIVTIWSHPHKPALWWWWWLMVILRFLRRWFIWTLGSQPCGRSGWNHYIPEHNWLKYLNIIDWSITFLNIILIPFFSSSFFFRIEYISHIQLLTYRNFEETNLSGGECEAIWVEVSLLKLMI